MDIDVIESLNVTLAKLGEKGTVVNKVIAWLSQALSNVPRGELCDLLMKYFT